MKKLFTFLFLIGLTSICKADIFDYSKAKEYTIYFSSSSPTTFTGTTSYILIDLSSTTIWPHKETGGIHITSIYTEFDKAAASTTSIRLGVINFVNTSTGSITWFDGTRSVNNVSNTNAVYNQEYPDFGIDTKVTRAARADLDGLTNNLLSTEKTSGAGTVNLSTGMPTILNAYAFPAVGDIVMEISKAATAISYYIRIKYYTDK